MATPAIVDASVPVGAVGAVVLAEVARAAAAAHGGGADVAALAIRIAAVDATRRCTVDPESATLELRVVLDGTELEVTLHDTGEPTTGPPAEVLSLVDLGLATGVTGGSDGLGNQLTIRVPLDAHDRLLDEEGLEVLGEDVPATDVPVTVRSFLPEDAAALTRCIYRCYGWSYPDASMYFPDRIAAALTSGRRIGEVAITDDGEIAAHWGAVTVADGVVETGGTVTDPRFRGRGLAAQLGDRLLERLKADGVRGRLREPVLTHPATQKIALREGATHVGVYLNVVAPLQQVGITDGVTIQRPSLTLMYSPLLPLSPATLWVPPLYEPIARRVVERSGWPRQLGEPGRGPEVPVTSVVQSSFNALNRRGEITVPVVGSDLIDVLDDSLSQLRRAGAEMTMVFLPANQEALVSIGAGLGPLCLGFASLIPDFGELGDALVLQWLADPDVDDSDWQYADESVEELAHMIISQARQLGDAAVRLRRRAAQRQQILAALPTED